MTLEENEDIGLDPPAWRHGAESERRSQTRLRLALTRCAEIAAVTPVIILLLPVYALIRIFAAIAGIGRILRGIRRHIPHIYIPDACGASQNLKLR